MLDLQRVKQHTEAGGAESASATSLGAISFRVDGSFVGSIGTTLQPADVWASTDTRGDIEGTNLEGSHSPNPYNMSQCELAETGHVNVTCRRKGNCVTMVEGSN